jgi:hypothetical protein
MTAKGTANESKQKIYSHPEFPKLTMDELESKAASFDLDTHLVALMFDEPFYADIIRSLHKEATRSIDTAGVLYADGVMRFWWNPLFLAPYNNSKIRGILKHEGLHLALEHTTTRRYKPHKVWNIACDLAINSTLTLEEMPDCGFRPGKPFRKLTVSDSVSPEEVDRHQKLSDLIVSMPKDLASEEYFALLMNDPNVQEMLKSSGEGESLVEGNMDSHEGWDDLSEDDREYISSKIREVVKAAQQKADATNRWGSIPAHMREEIRKKVSGEIDWKSVLRQFVGCTQRADRLSSVYRLNKKYPGIHAGTSRDYKPTIHVYLDQSGSVSDEAIGLFFGELGNLAHRVDFKLFYFDTEVDEENSLTWKRGSFPKTLRTRSGGTDFEAPTKHAAKSKCEGYLILTDGEAPKPSSSRIRRGWVLMPGGNLIFDDPDQKDVIIKMKKPLI